MSFRGTASALRVLPTRRRSRRRLTSTRLLSCRQLNMVNSSKCSQSRWWKKKIRTTNNKNKKRSKKQWRWRRRNRNKWNNNKWKMISNQAWPKSRKRLLKAKRLKKHLLNQRATVSVRLVVTKDQLRLSQQTVKRRAANWNSELNERKFRF